MDAQQLLRVHPRRESLPEVVHNGPVAMNPSSFVVESDASPGVPSAWARHRRLDPLRRRGALC